ncbi:hypothetical protein BED46_014640 [Burkholderia contaminans]|uniref:Uncharacterized protein n=1 Tax=Burkholderia contaminans LMG 23361 TaxID=1334628 RepID=A0ABD4AIS9_9BURK|nr:hypothetical protein WR31_28880 [Burkholderia contaminans LMG 23361]MBA9842343.1 hypothetical protein [Burkholderia contaminans]MBA9862631.1 hypothetical protein [Burkholderia contaminans]MBA9932728.1 hypothetical protein [Burkholderia contaminans]MCB4331334.1 hypothetical protein [Burkholderia contaminans]
MSFGLNGETVFDCKVSGIAVRSALTTRSESDVMYPFAISNKICDRRDMNDLEISGFYFRIGIHDSVRCICIQTTLRMPHQ